MRYKLNSSRTLRAGLQLVPLNIIRLFHVFCDGREGLVEFLRWQTAISVKLLHEQEEVA